MTAPLMCEWPTGTVYTGPRTCGKPAKHRAEKTGEARLVCGIHARTARNWSYTVEPLEVTR